MIIPKNSKDAQGFRDFLGAMKAQMCSLGAMGQAATLKPLIDAALLAIEAALGKIPTTAPDETWTMDNGALVGCLCSAQSINAMISAEWTKLTTQSLAAQVTTEIERMITAGEVVRKDGITALVDAAIKAKMEAGEFVPKTQVEQLCSSAKVTGEQAGRAARDAELAEVTKTDVLATTRKSALTTAGKPLPPAEVEAILKAAEVDFKAAEALFDTRVAAFTAAGFNLTPELLANAWLPEADFKRFEKMVGGIPALKGKRGDPFAGGGGGGGTDKKLPRLC